VDFVINNPLSENKAYEVKFNTMNIKLSKYKKFITNYPQYPLHFIGYDISETKNTIPAIKL